MSQQEREPLCTRCGRVLEAGCCDTTDIQLGGMTVRELIELLQAWPLSAPVTFGDTIGRPRQYVQGEPVTVDGVTLPEGLYIGWLTGHQLKALGWTVQP